MHLVVKQLLYLKCIIIIEYKYIFMRIYIVLSCTNIRTHADYISSIQLA